MDLKNLSEMTRDDRRLVLCQLLHTAIHFAHDQSDFLIDDDKHNDDDSLRSLGMTLKEIFQLYSTIVEYRN